MMGVPERQPPRRWWSSEEILLFVIDPRRIRRARVELKIPQWKLARWAGCSQNAISLIERGATRWVKETLALDLAEALRKPLEYLFSEVPVIGMLDVTSETDSELQNEGAA
jgi:DNA-binding XRE family transcriptional regulator